MKEETTINGRTVRRRFFCGRERYEYDWNICSGGDWVQYDTDQDFRCFGVWVSPKTRQVMTFAEGDEILVTCATEDIFQAELKALADFHGPPPPALISYDSAGNRTEHYDERGSFGR